MAKTLMTLKLFRTKKGFTQQQMANTWGMTKVQYERRERGEIRVKTDEIGGFSEKFGITLDEAVGILIPALEKETVNI